MKIIYRENKIEENGSKQYFSLIPETWIEGKLVELKKMKKDPQVEKKMKIIYRKKKENRSEQYFSLVPETYSKVKLIRLKKMKIDLQEDMKVKIIQRKDKYKKGVKEWYFFFTPRDIHRSKVDQDEENENRPTTRKENENNKQRKEKCRKSAEE